MVPEVRPEDPGLVHSETARRLREEPFSFEFFQAVRLLERLQPDRLPVGQFAHPRKEVARFTAHPSVAFPASQIQSLEWSESGLPKMEVNFMGMIGPLGVLPLYYTELVASRVRSRDHTMREFLDIFHHRIISLFYQAWEKHHFAVVYEREGKDRLFQYLLDLIGLGTPGLQKRHAVRDETLVFYSGLLSRQAKSAATLRNLVGDYFDIDVEIEQFVGVWRTLDLDDQCCVDEESVSSPLGFGTVVGDEVWDPQSRVRIKLGPLTMKQYREFLPGGNAHEPLRSLTKAFSTDLEYEVQLILRKEEVPACELGSVHEPGPVLGWLTWMKSTPVFGRDPGDTVLLLN